MKLYMAQYVFTEEELDAAYSGDEIFGPEFAEPAGWAEYSQERWGEYREFFAPSDRKIYRSRSAAQGRVNLINRWFGDGAAVLIEAEPRWTPVTEANAARKRARRQVHIDRLRDQIAALEESL